MSNKINRGINETPLSLHRAWQGRRFKTKEYKDYEKLLLATLPTMEKIEGRIIIVYNLFLKRHASRDWDNCIKPLQDILQKKGYFEDDRKIYFAMVRKIPSDQDRIEVEIYPEYKE